MRSGRGVFLSALIVIFGVAVSLASALLIFDSTARQALGSFPAWFPQFVAALLVARLVTLYSIWECRRWGVYSLFLLEAVEVGMGVFVFSGGLSFHISPILPMAGFAVVILVWFLALRPRWQFFR